MFYLQIGGREGGSEEGRGGKEERKRERETEREKLGLVLRLKSKAHTQQNMPVKPHLLILPQTVP